MRKPKLLMTIALCIFMVLSSTLPVYAADARLSHGVAATCVFDVTPTGEAEAMVTYAGNSTSFTNIAVETYIQKRTLGFIWTKVDNGEDNKTWVDTSTADHGSFFHSLQLASTGTYRAVFKITFSGTGADDDVIEDKIEAVYE